MTTLRLAAAVALAGSLAACDTASPTVGAMPAMRADPFDPITTEQEFRAHVVGREVEYAGGAVGTYRPNNTWEVSDASGTIAHGTWEWRGDRWCYEGTAPQGPVAGCERVAVSLTGVRFTREDGTEGVLPFRI